MDKLKPIRRQLPIKAKLRIVVLLVNALSLFLALSIIGFIHFKEYKKSLVENVAVLAQSVSYNVESTLKVKDTGSAKLTLSSLQSSPEIIHAVLFTDKGEELAEYLASSDVKFKREFDLNKTGVSYFKRDGIEYLECYSPILSQSKFIGTLYIQASLEKYSQRFDDYTALSFVVIFITLSIMLLVTEAMQLFITKPLTFLTRTIDNIRAKNDYSARVDHIVDDEIGRLIDDFNQMLECIEKRDKQLIAYQATLEKKVDERTEDLLLAKEKAEKAVKAKSDFLSNISHELRTPMNAILGFSQLLINDDLSQDQQENVQEIIAAGEHLLSLIDGILDVSKFEYGEMYVSLGMVDIYDAVNEVLPVINRMIKEKNISFTNGISERNYFLVNADYLRLQQVLENLLSNAIKYNNHGGSARIEAELMNGWVRVSVIDSGIGIDADKIAELFKPFSRLGSEVSAIEGTGIGLSLCKHLIERMGGRIGVESNLNQGSCFWFELKYVSVH